MKKVKIIGVIVSFILSFIFHFVYNIFPNTFFSIFAPVNESIWEHMKLIITGSIIFSIFEYFYYQKEKIKYNNFWFSYAISCIIGIITYLLIYIPLDTILHMLSINSSISFGVTIMLYSFGTNTSLISS